MLNAVSGRNAACPCGSGKKFKRCCGRSQPSPETRAHGVEQALAYLQQGQFSLAEALLADLAKNKPRDPTIRYLLGYAALQSGRYVDATSAMREAIALGLTDPAAFYHYGCALSAVGHYPDAATAFEQALALKPDFTAAVTHLANCQFELQQFAQAERLYRETLAVEPNNFVASHNLGQVFYLTQRIGEAIAYFQHAADAAPAVAEFRASLATMQEADNQLDAAEVSARLALNSEPRNTSASIALARVLRRRDKPEEALAVLDTADLHTSLPRSQIAFWSERGQILEKLERFPDAFEAYAHSKTRLAETRAPYDGGARMRHMMARECEVVTPDRIANWTVPSSPAQPAPVFIVGFPRSGTTLLEQMLGCHPAVVACGELQTVLEHEASGEFLDALHALDEATRLHTVAALRQEYLAVLHGSARPDDTVRYATDKLPLNMMRIGLIRLLFPEAKIIHVLRHPLDTALSAYFTPFLFGNEWSMNLLDTARMFGQTWQHIESMKTLPGLHFTRIRYEDLITAPEATLRQVLGFLDLPWNAACLDFHTSARVARTASYAQVTRTLYQSSKNRHRNFLTCCSEDVLDAMRPVIAASGYDIE